MIESAPATMPATRVVIFAPALAPLSPAILILCCARVDRPAVSARRMAGTKPAADTRLGSSNEIESAAGV